MTIVVIRQEKTIKRGQRSPDTHRQHSEEDETTNQESTTNRPHRIHNI